MKKVLSIFFILASISAFSADSNATKTKMGMNPFEYYKSKGGSISFYQEYAVADVKKFDTDTVNAFSQLTFKFKVEEKSWYIAQRFNLGQVYDDADNVEVDNNYMRDLLVGYKTKRFNDGILSYTDNLRLRFATREANSDAGKTVSPFYSFNANYIVNPTMNYGIAPWHYYHIIDNDTAGAEDLDNYITGGAASYWNYNLSDKVALALSYILEWGNKDADNTLSTSDFDIIGRTFRTSLNLTVGDWGINPFIDFNVSESFNPSNGNMGDNASIGVELAGSLL
ncbi:MAG: hypothetical protein ACI9QD_000212 [Thermoproteota archaeon]|jgi:hypothetical protein